MHDNIKPLPPPPGQMNDWFSLVSLPCQTISSGLTSQVWLERFQRCGSVEAITEELRNGWASLTPGALRRFAFALLDHHLVGILHSKVSDGRSSEWLILSAMSTDQDYRRAIERGIDVPGALYLPSPNPELSKMALPEDNLLLRFFVAFGGLRLAPPFQAGCFHDVPSGPMEIIPGELDKFEGTEWENSAAIFTCSVGDELLSNSQGKLGWLRHETRNIEPSRTTFDQVLTELSKTFQINLEV